MLALCRVSSFSFFTIIVQTAQNRDKNKKIQEKRKALLEARLAKVKQRKLKQKIESEDNSEGIAAFNFSDNDAGPSESETELTGTYILCAMHLRYVL